MVKKSETEEERYTTSFFKEGGKAFHISNRGCNANLRYFLNNVYCLEKFLPKLSTNDASSSMKLDYLIYFIAHEIDNRKWEHA